MVMLRRSVVAVVVVVVPALVVAEVPVDARVWSAVDAC